MLGKIIFQCTFRWVSVIPQSILKFRNTKKIGAEPENLHVDTPSMTLGVVLLKWIIFEKDIIIYQI